MVRLLQIRQRLTTNGIDYEEPRDPLHRGGLVRPFVVFRLWENTPWFQ